MFVEYTPYDVFAEIKNSFDSPRYPVLFNCTLLDVSCKFWKTVMPINEIVIIIINKTTKTMFFSLFIFFIFAFFLININIKKISSYFCSNVSMLPKHQIRICLSRDRSRIFEVMWHIDLEFQYLNPNPSKCYLSISMG